jgi:uncharacterized protein YcsI (UPF0317 family)
MKFLKSKVMKQEDYSMDDIKEDSYAEMHPEEFRQIIREDNCSGTAMSACSGYARANLVIVPCDVAFDFLLFCNRNPQTLPLLEAGDPGNPTSMVVAPGADIRTDLVRYQIIENGVPVAKPTNIKDCFKDDSVFFLIGCSDTFSWMLKANNLKYRFIGGYVTSLECNPAGIFAGHIVVTCRVFENSQYALRAIEISSRYPGAHGSPVYMGEPAGIGIKDIYQPEYPTFEGSPENIKPGEVLLYWPTGVTSQLVAKEIKLPFMITHDTDCTFITNQSVTEIF